MMKSQLFKCCPVCDMDVDNEIPELSFQGIEYQFCSHQCRHSFKTHPHLYIGRPGYPSPRKTLHCVNKRFTITVPSEILASDLKKNIQSMMGVISCSITDNKLLLEYDLLQVSLKEILDEIAATGIYEKLSLWQKLKVRHRLYVERNEQNSLSDDGHFSGRCH